MQRVHNRAAFTRCYRLQEIQAISSLFRVRILAKIYDKQCNAKTNVIKLTSWQPVLQCAIINIHIEIHTSSDVKPEEKKHIQIDRLCADRAFHPNRNGFDKDNLQINITTSEFLCVIC